MRTQEGDVTQDRTDALRRELKQIHEDLSELRNKTGELEQRLLRLEVKEELLESPGAAGDQAVRFK
jgi:predicted  nucleic acid-binding Zn-ribbon protein